MAVLRLGPLAANLSFMVTDWVHVECKINSAWQGIAGRSDGKGRASTRQESREGQALPGFPRVDRLAGVYRDLPRRSRETRLGHAATDTASGY